MNIKPITPEFSVSEQIAPEDVEVAARQGIKSIICNRPNGEGGPSQASVEEIEAAAQQHGIEFRSIPFTAGKQTEQDIAAFSEALSKMPAPVLAYCRTGTRSSQIWAQSRVATAPVQETVDLAATAGIDLSGMRAALEQLSRKT